MLNAVRKHKILFLIISMAVIYASQFLLLPRLMTEYYPVSNESYSILIIPLVLFSVVINILIDVNLGLWAIADVMYGIMIAVFSGNGLYSIGMRGVSLDGMTPRYSLELALITILIIVIALFVFQALIRVLRLAFIKMKKQNSNNN